MPRPARDDDHRHDDHRRCRRPVPAHGREGLALARRQLPDAVERPGAQPVRRADHRTGDPGAGRADAERDRVGGRRAQRGAGRRLPRRRASRRRLDRPHAQAPRHDRRRRRQSRRTGRTPRARPVRRARDLAHDRRRPHHGRRDRVLRRVEPEHHPVARADRSDRRGERQAAVDRAAGRPRRPRGRRVAGRGARRSARDLHHRRHVPGLVRGAAVHPRPRAAALARRPQAAACTRSARACAGCSATRCCAASSARPASRTSSARSPRPSCRSSRCASSA